MYGSAPIGETGRLSSLTAMNFGVRFEEYIGNLITAVDVAEHEIAVVRAAIAEQLRREACDFSVDADRQCAQRLRQRIAVLRAGWIGDGLECAGEFAALRVSRAAFRSELRKAS